MFNLFGSKAGKSASNKTSASSTKTVSRSKSSTVVKSEAKAKATSKSKPGRKPKAVCELKTLSSNLGSLIRSSRKEKGLSIKDLSSSSNVSTAVIFKVESGKGLPNITSIAKMIPSLGLDWSSIFNANLISNSSKSSSSTSNWWSSYGLTSSEIKQVQSYIEWIKYQRTSK